MKLVRYGAKGAEKPGLIDSDGQIRDLSAHVPDIAVEAIARIAAIDHATLPVVPGNSRLGVPVKGIGKIVAIGLNYRDHAIESGLPIPTEPVMFMKALSSLTGPNDIVMLPEGSTHSDWEVELGFIVGKTARYVSQADALGHVAGYVVANDVSERFNQKQRGSQWSKGKGHDTFCPVGPWLVTPEELADPMDLTMHLDLNGARMQTGNTRTMIFNLAEIISYVSRYVTLEPGDLVITGTPPGVGEGKSPQVFLKAGDVMELGIEGLGQQRQEVVAFDLDRLALTCMRAGMRAPPSSPAGPAALAGHRPDQIAGQGAGGQGDHHLCADPRYLREPHPGATAPSQVEYMRSKIPMGRLGEVEESVAMVCFMASEECSFTTASVFDTSGGRTTY